MTKNNSTSKHSFTHIELDSTKAAYQYLLMLLAENNDTKNLSQILEALLTDKEQHELANRLRIFALLQQGRPQREISEKLGVGIATVSRGAKAYQQLKVNELLPSLAKDLSK
ncbi:MAG: transcriptional regulator [Gammaproteobacteria bacterium]|nr:MAG: transcriptional regulator [Gammaproteobacteria bacterium]